ncbi:hypothetical protein HYS97_01710 [Candidatus Daviesbacteria bacterium]|nr:hypothetical protein [Candidatus Daviesbacteria bacterium]
MARERLYGGRSLTYWGHFFDMGLFLNINIYTDKVQVANGRNLFLPRYQPQVRIQDQRPRVIKTLDEVFSLERSKKVKKQEELLHHSRWYSADPAKCWDFLYGIESHMRIRRVMVRSFIDFLEDKLAYRQKYGEDAAARRDLSQLKREAELAQAFFIQKNTPFTALYVPTPESLAGILDTYGSMRIKLIPPSKQLKFQSRVEIETVHTGLLEGLTVAYQGTQVNPKSRNKQGQIIYTWEAAGTKSRRVLEEVVDWLLFRKEICAAVLDFQDHQERVKKSFRGMPRSQVIDPAEVERRNAERWKLYADWINTKIKAGEYSRNRHISIF